MQDHKLRLKMWTVVNTENVLSNIFPLRN